MKTKKNKQLIKGGATQLDEKSKIIFSKVRLAIKYTVYTIDNLFMMKDNIDIEKDTEPSLYKKECFIKIFDCIKECINATNFTIKYAKDVNYIKKNRSSLLIKPIIEKAESASQVAKDAYEKSSDIYKEYKKYKPRNPNKTSYHIDDINRVYKEYSILFLAISKIRETDNLLKPIEKDNTGKDTTLSHSRTLILDQVTERINKVEGFIELFKPIIKAFNMEREICKNIIINPKYNTSLKDYINNKTQKSKREIEELIININSVASQPEPEPVS